MNAGIKGVTFGVVFVFCACSEGVASAPPAPLLLFRCLSSVFRFVSSVRHEPTMKWLTVERLAAVWRENCL